MNTTEISTEDVTAATVTAAEAEAAEAERALVELETRLTGGDLAVTADQLSTQEKLVRHAKLALEGVRSLWTQREARERAKAIQALRDEVIKTAPKSGDDLVKALEAVEQAARAFVDLADAHDERLRQWIMRAQEFHIEQGRTEHGVGVNGIGQLIVNGIVFATVNGPLRLGGVFHNEQTGSPVPLPIRREHDAARVATYRNLDAIGEGL